MKEIKLTGQSYKPDQFKIAEGEKVPDFHIIDQMLKGEGPPVYIVRKFVDVSTADAIRKQFYNIIDKTGGGNRNDSVKSFQIGANQWGKNSKDYFKECNLTRGYVNEILDDVTETGCLADFLLEKSLINYFIEKGIYFGPSYYRGNYSNLFTARLWVDGEDRFSLQAHEDLSQVKLALADNYEISSAKYVVAKNLCVENGFGSNLLLWNISPDEHSKTLLNLSESGYPYPMELLKDWDYLSLSTQPGDLYFINANFLHAVEKSAGDSRITLGRFMGYTADNRIAYWT